MKRDEVVSRKGEERSLQSGRPPEASQTVHESVKERNEKNDDPNNTPWNRLSDKKKKTAEFYVAGLSRNQAMIKAGYGKEYARQRCKFVFSDPDLLYVIEEMQADLADKAEVSPEWVVSQLRAIAGADLVDLVRLDSLGPELDLRLLDPNLRIAIEEITVDEYTKGRGENATPARKVRVKLASKLKALEMLCRKLGLFEDKVTIQGDQSITDRITAGRQRAKLRVVK